MPYRELFFDRPGDAEQGKKEELQTALPKIDEMLRELFSSAGTIPDKATLEQAGLGVDNTTFMTPFLVKTAAILFAADGVFNAGTAYAAGTIGEALKLRALLASPEFTGAPLAPTAAPGTNTTQISTTAFVQAAIAALVDSSPGTLDTLNELAAALGDDPNFATTTATALANRIRYDAAQSLSGPQSLQARQNLGLTVVGDALAIASSKNAALQAIDAPWQLLSEVTVSGSPGNVEFTGLSGTLEHRLLISGVRPATDDMPLILQVQTGGSTWQTSGYVFAGRLQAPAGGADTGSTVDSYSSGIVLTRVGAGNGVGNAAGEGAEGEVSFVPADTNHRRRVRSAVSFTRSDGADCHAVVGGAYGSSGAITGVRLVWVSGNFANVGRV